MTQKNRNEVFSIKFIPPEVLVGPVKGLNNNF